MSAEHRGPQSAKCDGVRTAQSLADGALETNAKPETGNGELPSHDLPFALLSDEEREAAIMRFSKNHAYFIPEDQLPKPQPESVPDRSLEDLLKEALTG